MASCSSALAYGVNQSDTVITDNIGLFAPSISTLSAFESDFGASTFGKPKLVNKEILAEYGGGYVGMLIGVLVGNAGAKMMGDGAKRATKCANCDNTLRLGLISISSSFVSAKGVQLVGADYGIGGNTWVSFLMGLVPAVGITMLGSDEVGLSDTLSSVLFSFAVPAGTVLGFNLTRRSVPVSGIYLRNPNKPRTYLNVRTLEGAPALNLEYRF
ncbi:MAG: hypothetical protein OEZ47_09780 [Gammaproteobacteria bacterium]|nr:hypothetical protein [Gammaproteobacteria bacterium]